MMSSSNEHNEFGWAYKVCFEDLGMCGCGLFNDRLNLLKEVLTDMPIHTEPYPAWIRTPLGEWFLTTIDNAGLIEHGSSIGGSWLTDKGERFLKCLEDVDALESWFDKNGYCGCFQCALEGSSKR